MLDNFNNKWDKEPDMLSHFGKRDSVGKEENIQNTSNKEDAFNLFDVVESEGVELWDAAPNEPQNFEYQREEAVSLLRD